MPVGSGLLFTEHSDPIAVTQELREVWAVFQDLRAKQETIERVVISMQEAMLEAGLIDSVDDLSGRPIGG